MPSERPFSQVLFLSLRCLKENILVTDCGRACLTDVGINNLAVRGFYNGFNPVPSAWSYKAPEELLLGTRDKRSDVYSLACTIYAVSMHIYCGVKIQLSFILSDYRSTLQIRLFSLCNTRIFAGLCGSLTPGTCN